MGGGHFRSVHRFQIDSRPTFNCVLTTTYTPAVVFIGSFSAPKPQIFGDRRDLGGEGGREREGPAGGRGAKGDGTGSGGRGWGMVCVCMRGEEGGEP